VREEGTRGGSFLKQDKARVVFVVILLIAISSLFVAMTRKFLMTILLAAIFSGLAQPLYKLMLRLTRGRKAVATVLTLIILIVVIVGPLLMFLGVVTNQAVEIADAARPWIQRQVGDSVEGGSLGSGIPSFGPLEPYRAQILEKLAAAVGAIGDFVVTGLSAATRGTINFLFHLSIMLYAMFFFLGDGKTILDKLLSYIPLTRDDKDRLVGNFLSVSRATIKGIIVIGLVQGALAGIGFAVAGINAPVFWGTLMAVLSIIPGLGTALVWVPTVIYLVATGHQLTGILLALYCMLIVGSADNVLRPRLVGKDVKMHELFVLFGTLGGVLFFGFVGFIVGPILAALFVTIWDIYETVFKESLAGSETDSG
jgi:predicted PurR-regulated permease PerM